MPSLSNTVTSSLGRSQRPPSHPSHPGAADIDFQSVLELFTHKHTRHLFPVQANALTNIITASENGLKFPHLKHILSVLTFAIDAVDSESPAAEVFLDPLCRLLALLGRAFVTTRAHEEVDYAYELSSAMTFVGSCLRCVSPRVVLAATQTVSAFVNHNKSGLAAHGSMPLHPNLALCPPALLHYYIVAHSGIIATLNEVMEEQAERAEGPDLCTELARTLKNVSFAPVCATQVIETGFFDMVPLMLNLDARAPRVDVLLELVWNLVASDASASLCFGTEENVRVLMVLLQQLLSKGHGNQDKELRNEILVILSLVADQAPNRQNLARTTCLRTMLLYSTCSELYDSQLMTELEIQPFTQSVDRLDLEMKLLMWSIAAKCIGERFGHAQVVQAELLRAVLLYVDLAEVGSNPTIARWPFTQLLQLQKAALQILAMVAPALPDQCAALGTIAQLLHFAQGVVANPDRLVERQLAAHQTRQLQALSLKVLLHAAANIDFSTMTHSAETIRLLLDLFYPPVEPPADPSQPPPDLRTRSNAIHVLALLVQANPLNQRAFRKAGGLRAIGAFINDTAGLRNAAKTEPSLLSALVECIWHVVVFNSRNESFFLVEDGMDCLLNLLCLCDPSITKQVLGCIANLLCNPKAVKYFKDWRLEAEGTEAPTAMAVMLDLWDRHAEWLPAQDLRPAIYAIAASAGFEPWEGASSAQCLSLKAIEKLVDLLRGEMYQNIQQSLQEEEGLVPVPDDVGALDKAITMYQDLQQEVEAHKQAQLERRGESEATEMSKFYSKIHERRNQECSKPRAPKTASSSVMRNRLAAKNMKQTMLANSLDVEATMRKTAGSGARAAMQLRGGQEDQFGDPEFQAKYTAQLALQGRPSMPHQPASGASAASS